MHRKRSNLSPHYKQNHSIKLYKTSTPTNHEKQLQIQLYLTKQQTPLIINVPLSCNMKILKSIIYYHLESNLNSSEYSKIIGFQTIPNDYHIDYKLRLGIGELTHNLNLVCLNKNIKYPSDSLLNYKICRLISVGGFSKVYLLRDLSTGEFMAGKFINKQNANLELVQNQYFIASQLHNPNIIKTHNFIETEHFYVIIMQYLPGGQLFDLLKQHRHMPQESAKFYLVQTLLALQYLHNQNIIYRDIKPQNIIIDYEGHIKLTDFGLAKLIKNKSYSFCGSLDYMAPEIIQQQGYSYEIDYYSVGNLLFEILLGSPPFYHPKYTQQQTKHHIMHSQVKFTQSMKLSSSVIDLMTQLLQKKPQNRLGHIGGLQQILKHQWFKDIDLQKYQQRQIDAPFKAELRTISSEQNTEEQKQSNLLIQSDLKKLRIRQQFKSQKQKRVNFHNRKNCEQRSISKQSPHRSQSKLKSNLSLLYVMTQKRSSSLCPPPNRKLLKSSMNKQEMKASGMFRSLNLSRKSSMVLFAQNKYTAATSSKLNSNKLRQNGSQPQLGTNFVLHFSKKNKQNIGNRHIRKKRKQSTTLLKFAK